VKMIFAVSTQVFEKEILSEDHLTLFKRLGFDDIEIFLTLPHFDWRDARYVAAMHTAIKKTGLSVCGVHAPWMPGMDIASLEDEERKTSVMNVKMAVDLLQRLGGHILVVHPGAALGTSDDIAAKLKRSQESLSAVAKYCQERGVRIALENPPTNELGGDPERLRSLYDCLPQENIQACFDTGHAHIAGGLELWRSMAKEIVYVHLHDNNGVEDQHVPPGMGRIDWEVFFQLLRESRFQGIVSLELSPIRNAVDVLLTSREWFRTMSNKYGL